VRRSHHDRHPGRLRSTHPRAGAVNDATTPPCQHRSPGVAHRPRTPRRPASLTRTIRGVGCSGTEAVCATYGVHVARGDKTKQPRGRNSASALPAEVAERLGPCYVYVLVDPRGGMPFYVGKGTGNRVISHGRRARFEALEPERKQAPKTRRIREIRAAGNEPRIDIARHGLTPEEAFLVEAALIDGYDGIVELTNAVSRRRRSTEGGDRIDVGRAPLTELIARYGAEALTAREPPVLLIRLQPRWKPRREELEPGYWRKGSGWFPEISATELFDSTRGWWRVSARSVSRRGVGHVIAVVAGVSRAAPCQVPVPVFQVGSGSHVPGRVGVSGGAGS